MFCPIQTSGFLLLSRGRNHFTTGGQAGRQMPITSCKHQCFGLLQSICYLWPELHEDLPSPQFQAIAMPCTWRTRHHPLTSNNKHDARGQSHVGFCRILHVANTDAFQSENAHKEAKDAQDDTHNHEGPHSLEHCCKTNWKEPRWVTEVRFVRAWKFFKDCFCLKIKALRKKTLDNRHRIYSQRYLGHLWKCGCLNFPKSLKA